MSFPPGDNGQRPRTRAGDPPLAGIRVLDFTKQIAGGGNTRVLAGLGSEVLRVEWPHYPALDGLRTLPPFHEGRASLNHGAFFNQTSVNKKSFILNVKAPGARPLLEQLIRVSDVVADNFPPRVMKSWGLDYESLRRINPRIIAVSGSGFGQKGPYADFRSYGPTAQAYSGLTQIVGLPGRPPAGWGFSYMDNMGSWFAALGVLMALHHRMRTGEGSFVDHSQALSGVLGLGPTALDHEVNGRTYRRPDRPAGNRSTYPRVAPHYSYRCAGEDSWCVIACETDAQWDALCRVAGRGWEEDPRWQTVLGRLEHETELDAAIEGWTRTLDRHAVIELLAPQGVFAAPCATIADKALRDPQNQHRGTYFELDSPLVGRHLYEGIPLHFEATPWRYDSPAPALGEHNDYVFRGLLGLSDAALRELVAAGVTIDAEDARVAAEVDG
jgi:crotonobetainyl-CoA:carnitine CoA-transferase CaiB-like acyl-CoA transferase